MTEEKNIVQLEDIKLLVDEFYGKVRNDALLAPIFNERIKDRWPEHLEKMYKFWQTVLIGPHAYFGSPFTPHANMPIDKQHFDRWLALFFETIEQNFTGEKADEAKWRAERMAEMFQYKIGYYKSNPEQSLL